MSPANSATVVIADLPGKELDPTAHWGQLLP
jgi:hypothetical protein